MIDFVSHQGKKNKKIKKKPSKDFFIENSTINMDDNLSDITIN